MEDNIQMDVKATLREVKRQLKFLADHIWLLQEADDPGMVEDSFDIMDYLSYTRSVIQVSKDSPSFDASSKVITAMERRHQAAILQRQRQQVIIQRMQELLWAIRMLPQREKEVLWQKYVLHISYEHIANRMEVSQSSIGRIIQQGCLHLAQLLDLEKLQEHG